MMEGFRMNIRISTLNVLLLTAWTQIAHGMDDKSRVTVLPLPEYSCVVTEDEEKQLKDLQEANDIPFVKVEEGRSWSRNLNLFARSCMIFNVTSSKDPRINLAMIVSKNGLHVSAAEPLPEEYKRVTSTPSGPSVFVTRTVLDSSALAAAYANIIGINDENGSEIVSRWDSIIRTAPRSFINLTYRHLMDKEKCKQFEEFAQGSFPVGSNFVDRYTAIFKAILNQKPDSNDYLLGGDHQFIDTMTRFFRGTRGCSNSDSCRVARYAQYCHQTPVPVLRQSPNGRQILTDIEQDVQNAARAYLRGEK